MPVEVERIGHKRFQEQRGLLKSVCKRGMDWSNGCRSRRDWLSICKSMQGLSSMSAGGDRIGQECWSYQIKRTWESGPGRSRVFARAGRIGQKCLQEHAGLDESVCGRGQYWP